MQSQSETLRRQLRVLAPSEWGRRWDLSAAHCVNEFRRRVPLTDYADYYDAIEQIEFTGTNPLTTERVRLLEPTSGTSSQKKLIPYTATLRSEFQFALAVWVDDLFSKRPTAMRGPAYWSVSPPLHQRRITRSGIPIGFDDDAAYLGFWSRLFAKQMFAVPSRVSQYAEAEDWRYATAWYLLQTPELALISVWSPTFLLELIRRIDGPWRSRLSRDLHDGTCRLPGSRQILARKTRMVGGRASCRRLAHLLERAESVPQLTQLLWPNLAVVSCWADASSGRYVQELQKSIPHAEIAPKGLLSTEAFISIPLIDAPGAALSLRSHFLEFESDDGTETLLAHELTEGARYQTIVTTGGGLYRYRTGDWVEVTGKFAKCPLVRFVGRDSTSDMVGEKLNDQFVQEVFDDLFGHRDTAVGFALLVPDEDNRRYRLFAERPADGRHPKSLGSCVQIAGRLEQLLCMNPYYRQARGLGQLLPATISLETTGQGQFRRTYDQLATSQGNRVGDIKPIALETHSLRAKEFLRLHR